jgi:two-component system NtrC family response regulator
VIRSEDLPAHIRNARSRVSAISLQLPDEGISLEEVEKEIIVQALEKHQGNQTRAARYLDISRKTLIYRMEKFGLMPAGDGEPLAKAGE